MMSSISITKVKNRIVNIEYSIFLWLRRIKLKNTELTILSNNCVGGVIYHDLGLRFLSPTINVGFEAEAFLRFLENIEYYMSLEIKEEKTDHTYPVGSIGDIKLYFVHYKSFDEAKAKWEERSKRINYDNLYILMTERDGCSMSVIERFDRLKYDHKVLITHTPIPTIKSTFYLPGFENCSELGVVTDVKKGFWRRRYIDDFDYVRFFNTGIIN